MGKFKEMLDAADDEDREIVVFALRFWLGVFFVAGLVIGHYFT